MNNLEAYRRKAGLMKKELAEKTGISESVLCRVEKGSQDMPGLRWALVAKVLECTVDDLIGIKGKE